MSRLIRLSRSMPVGGSAGLHSCPTVRDTRSARCLKRSRSPKRPLFVRTGSVLAQAGLGHAPVALRDPRSTRLRFLAVSYTD